MIMKNTPSGVFFLELYEFYLGQIKLYIMNIRYPDEWDPSSKNEMNWWMWILVVVFVVILYLVFYL